MSIIQHGANADESFVNGRCPPFLLAAQRGDIKHMALLLSLGASIHSTDRLGNSALHYAATEDAIEPLEFLLANGLDVNAVNDFGQAPLHRAALASKFWAMEYLLVRAARTEARDALGRTPVHCAVRRCSPLGVALLLRANPALNLNALDNQQRTPLHYAAMAGNASIMQFLLERGAEMEVPDALGKAPLHYAARTSEDCVICLLKAKPRLGVHAVDRAGQTPLHDAALAGRSSVMRLLARSGADVTARTANGSTLLHCAAKSGAKSACCEALQQRLSPRATDKKRRAPVDVAVGKARSFLLRYARDFPEPRPIANAAFA